MSLLCINISPFFFLLFVLFSSSLLFPLIFSLLCFLFSLHTCYLPFTWFFSFLFHTLLSLIFVCFPSTPYILSSSFFFSFLFVLSSFILTFSFFLLCITFTFCHSFSIYFSVVLSAPVTLFQSLCLNLLILVHQTRVWQRINCASLCLIHTICCNSQLDWLDSIKLTLFVTWLREIDLNIGRFKDWSFFITGVYVNSTWTYGHSLLFFFFFLSLTSCLRPCSQSFISLHCTYISPFAFLLFMLISSLLFPSYSFLLFLFIPSTYLLSSLLIVLSLSSFPSSFLFHFCLISSSHDILSSSFSFCFLFILSSFILACFHLPVFSFFHIFLTCTFSHSFPYIIFTQQQWLAMWYPITQLLHWYLHWSNRAALVR